MQNPNVLIGLEFRGFGFGFGLKFRDFLTSASKNVTIAYDGETSTLRYIFISKPHKLEVEEKSCLPSSRFCVAISEDPVWL